jgi:hypothetical protein
MTPGELPFEFETGEVLAASPCFVVEDGAVFGPADPGRAEQDYPPLLTVAWLDEPPSVTLEDVVEDLTRCLDDAESVLIDHQAVMVGGVEAVRTMVVHRGEHGRPTASEQWRLLTEGRRWTVSALTTLADQPALGPPLARVAESLRVSPRPAR